MVNIYKLELTKLQLEILRVLFVKTGKSLNQRQLANYLNVSQPAVRKALPKLEEIGFVKVNQDKETKRWLIELNVYNDGVMKMKRADNLRQIYESGLADFLEREFVGATIIFFGSFSRGDDTINSDIDIAIIGRKEKKLNLEKFEKMLEREIRINFYDSFNAIHKNLKENIFNGIVLAGGVEL